MPWPASLGLTVCAAVLIFPYSGFEGTAPRGLTFFGLIFKEISVGTALAVGASAIFYCFKMLGQIIDGTRGAMRSESAFMLDGTRGSSLAMLYTLMACFVFLELGGAQSLLRGMVTSFRLVPVTYVPTAAVLSSGVKWLVCVFSIAIQNAVWLAWPVMASMIFVDLVLGAICRSAPQLPVYFIGLPLRSSLGVLIAAFVLGRIAPVVSQMLDAVAGT